MKTIITGYQFGYFTLDILNKKLLITDDKSELTLGERNFQLLQLLCESSPNTLNKNKLILQLWPDTVVSDWSISRLISDTRQILNDNTQSVIKTARGIGFCIPDVTPLYQSQSIESHVQEIKKTSKVKLGIFVGITLFFALLAGNVYRYHTQQQLFNAISQVSKFQDNTYTAFVAQIKRRNELKEMLEERLNIKKTEQYEKFFAQHYDSFNQQEIFVCEQMRGITGTGLKINNQKIVDLIKQFPNIMDEIEGMKTLEQHLIFWLNKYHSVFKKRKDMCLVYVGVEDGVPYPSGIDQRVKDWLMSSAKK